MIRVAIALALSALLWCAAQAQFSVGPKYGDGFGFSALPSAGAPPGYTGPGDIITSGAMMWWGMRCYNNAYAGNVADITDSATGNTTGTRLQCSSGTVSALVSGSACTFVTGNACSSLATTCATACNVLTLYDQSGALKCAGAIACTVTNAANADRPTVTVSCQNSHPCMVFNGSAQQMLSAANLASTQAQPIYMSFVAKRTGNFTSFAGVAVPGSGGSPYGGFANAANQITCYAGNTASVAATDNAVHAAQIQFNSTTSVFYVDGASTTGQNCGTGSASGAQPTVGNSGFGQLMTGQVMEVGFWAGSNTGSNSTMNSNQHTYWSF